MATFHTSVLRALQLVLLFSPVAISRSIRESIANLGEQKLFGYGVSHLKQRGNVNRKDSEDGYKGGFGSGACENVEEFYFKEAVIDNFAPISKQQHWEGNGQRYWVNKEFWGGAGFPIFVWIGGEGAESCKRLSNRYYMWELAKDHQALQVDIEHRFYGESYPTQNMTTENLSYLSSEQALADLARLIGKIESDLASQNSEVITFGGSYPGNLAGWFRLKYPSVTKGSVASSAPLLAKTNFFEYMEVVADSITYFSGKKCNDALQLAAESISKLSAGGPGSSGYATLEKDFQTCSPMSSEKDLSILLSDLMGYIQGTVQYNNEGSSLNITNICEVMVDEGSDPYQQFVALATEFRAQYGLACEDASWADSVAYLSNPEKDPQNNGRPWTYQTCNEFGYFQTTDSEKQPFTSWKLLNLDFYFDLCREAFDGWTSEPQTDWINQDYGDIRIAGTNIIFPSGTIDPWHALGVTNSTPALPQPSELPLFILGTAHCADLYAPANSDPESLTYARSVINDTVSTWLKL